MSQMSFEDDLNARFDEIVKDLFTPSEINYLNALTWSESMKRNIAEQIKKYTYGSEGIVKHDNDDLTDDEECDKV